MAADNENPVMQKNEVRAGLEVTGTGRGFDVDLGALRANDLRKTCVVRVAMARSSVDLGSGRTGIDAPSARAWQRQIALCFLLATLARHSTIADLLPERTMN
jgi:hypothetical protein